ncbi:hypothetical protein ACFIOY_17390 [Bradyrhizobium sp. TZ2]
MKEGLHLLCRPSLLSLSRDLKKPGREDASPEAIASAMELFIGLTDLHRFNAFAGSLATPRTATSSGGRGVGRALHDARGW